ncbi:MAG: sugar ABC transporter permease [Firmicutes bacterium]|nr:sugar ABC transporter permease [Bacillota bacterium]
MNGKQIKTVIFITVMLFVPVVHFILFWGVVNFNSILLSFRRLDPSTGNMFFTFENFKSLPRRWESDSLRICFTNTFLTFGFLAGFLLPWGFFVTYFLYKKIPGSGLWRTMFFIPTVMPALAMTAIFVHLVDFQGPVGKLWSLFGKQPPFFLIEASIAKYTVLLYIFLTNFGGQFILFSGAMARIPQEVVEAAYIDGAGMRTEVFRITLPLCWPTISMLLLLNVAGLFMASGPILLLTRGFAETGTVAFWIFVKVTQNDLNLSAALGLFCTVVLFPVVLLARWGLGKVYADVQF